MQNRRQPRAAPGEARQSQGRPDGPDVNRDRLIFCITSLVGHRVTAFLRNNIQYEGIFHSCSLESDYSITLKCARRLPSEVSGRSGELVQTLLIPGKDFLSVSAMNVAPLSGEDDAPGRKGFATDAEISRKDTESSRDLVPWQAEAGYVQSSGGLDEASHDAQWDQFASNEQMYGLQSTWSEDLYTTKLDKNSIPLAKREQAERIAREIEAGGMHAEVEDRLDGDGDDEEAKFSAAQPLGGSAKDTKALMRAPLPQLPERAVQDNASDRGGRKGMISEMKRINALNLEPTSAKHDDSSGRSRMSGKDLQRNSRGLGSADLKSEFQQSLDLIARQEASKSHRKQQGGDAGAIRAAGNQSAGTPNSSFSFNPKAKAFSLNPQAGEFTPSGGAAGGATPVAKTSGPSPNFNVYKKDPNMQRKSLTDLLEPFFHRAKSSAPDSSAPEWPDAKGPSYKDVLGQPNPRAQPQMMPTGPGGCGGGQMPAMGGGWQPQGQPMMGQPGQQQPQQQPGQQVQQQPGPQQQVQQQGGPQNQDQGAPPMGVGGCQGGGMAVVPQMMQQNFVVGNAQGPGGPGGPPNQMQYGQMYGGPGGPGHQGQGGMGPQAIVFNQPTMMGQGGSQMVPMGMVAAQGQNPGNMGGMAPMPKFGGGNQQQMVVVPMMLAGPGQYNQQAFMQGGPMQQGGMAQGGPPGGPPQGDGSQGQMMQQPGMYQRQG
eukprot:TRINITY_DN50485_c0_g1_i1.p1 TRINITY_DN50485_c0_g1~~TRINITY_DN50485_c0_g1_i1.p1  ORF type:complete len:708 (+),score=153.23 TRINITY_DN50485_c0_g1_i1:189-2312(+)